MTELKVSYYLTHMNMLNWTKKNQQAFKTNSKFNKQLRKSGKEKSWISQGSIHQCIVQYQKVYFEKTQAGSSQIVQVLLKNIPARMYTYVHSSVYLNTHTHMHAHIHTHTQTHTYGFGGVG